MLFPIVTVKIEYIKSPNNTTKLLIIFVIFSVLVKLGVSIFLNISPVPTNLSISIIVRGCRGIYNMRIQAFHIPISNAGIADMIHSLY